MSRTAGDGLEDAKISSSQARDKRFEVFLGELLRAGFLLSAAVVFVGGVLYVIKYGKQFPHYGLFHGEPSDIRHPSDVFKDALGWHSRAIIQSGLLILIATPVARVAFSVAEFARERDWFYVATTLIVLAILIYSLSAT